MDSAEWELSPLQEPQSDVSSGHPPSASAVGVWTRVRDDIRGFLGVRTFDNWIARLILVGETDGEAVLAAPTKFERDRIRDDYLKSINLHWRRIDPDTRVVRVEACSQFSPALLAQAREGALRTGVAYGDRAAMAATIALADGEAARPVVSFSSFETLVEGPSNELALGIARRLAVGEAGPVSVVLFHGPNGVGKTHILEAIRQKRVEKNGSGPGVVLMSAEEFMLAFVEGVKRRDTSGLRNRVRRADMLLLDDIHLLKIGTLREFFSHLRAITAKGGWVVMTSDSSADRLELLDARMRDEMHGGVGIKIDRPDKRMRAQIVRIKAGLIARDFPEFTLRNEWVQMLADNLPSSGRVIDGAVRTIFAATILIDKPVTAEVVAASIRQEAGHKRTRVETIKDIVSAHYELTRADMESANRSRALSFPRQIAMYIARNVTTCSYPQIGRMFGGRDHTTVIYACNKLASLLTSDRVLADTVAELQKRCVDYADISRDRT